MRYLSKMLHFFIAGTRYGCNFLPCEDIGDAADDCAEAREPGDDADAEIWILMEAAYKPVHVRDAVHEESVTIIRTKQGKKYQVPSLLNDRGRRMMMDLEVLKL